MSFVFRLRPFSFFFLRSWYSTYRWKNPTSFENLKIYLIDIGAITIGYRKKEIYNGKW
jgi:hypothetical protein